MTLVSGEEPANGYYRFAAVLAAGAHNFYCHFEDGRGESARAPLAGVINQPSVYSHVIFSLTPWAVTTGGPAFVLTVNGADFPSGSIVAWDGSDRPTTFVSSSRVDAQIGANDIVRGKIVTIAVRDPAGGYGNPYSLEVRNPTPSLASLSPWGTSGGGPGIDLTLSGTGFVTNSLVRWKGLNIPTAFVSGTELRATLSAGDLTAGGRFDVTVTNPAPWGGTSNAVTFSVSDFTVGTSCGSLSGVAGTTFKCSVSAAARNGSFDFPVTLSCSGLPTGCTASISPQTVIPGSSSGAATLTIVTTARTSASGAAGVEPAAFPPPAAGLLLILALFLTLAGPARFRGTAADRPALRRFATAVLILLVIWLAACGGGGGSPVPGTPAGTYVLVIHGRSGMLDSMLRLTMVIQ